MRRRRIRLLLLVVVLVGIGVAGWTYTSATRTGQPLTVSGTVEADETLLGVEVAGRLVEVAVEEGQQVRAGDVIGRLDDELMQLQLRQADPVLRRQLEIQAERYVVRAPAGGTVTRVPVHVGEVLVPGQTVAAVADLTRLRLTVYVPERDLGLVQVGQAVDLRADPYPGRIFPGVVASINTQAEFTPRNVQTRHDREMLVFGVKVRVDNLDSALKPGLPVDATFAGTSAR